MLLAQGPILRTPGNCCTHICTVVLSAAPGPFPTFALFWKAQPVPACVMRDPNLTLHDPRQVPAGAFSPHGERQMASIPKDPWSQTLYFLWKVYSSSLLIRPNINVQQSPSWPYQTTIKGPYIHPFSFSADRVSETVTAFDEFPNSIIFLILHHLRTLALCGVRKCFCYSSLLNAAMPLLFI